MRISKITVEISPYFLSHQIELRCSVWIDGKQTNWIEIFPDSDFESRAEQYFDLMKCGMLTAIKNKENKTE